MWDKRRYMRWHFGTKELPTDWNVQASVTRWLDYFSILGHLFQWKPDWAIYWTLGNFQSLWQQLNCPNLLHS